MQRKVLALLVGLLLTSLSHAVCYRDGKPYPTGAVVNGYECQADGSWKKR